MKLLQEIKLYSDYYDKWGFTINVMFALCEYMHLNDYEVPEKWEYEPSTYLTIINRENDSFDSLFSEYEEAELIYFGNVLDRFTKKIEKAGESY